MANRTLSTDELSKANELLREVRSQLAVLAADDESLLWALRRKVCKELQYDERGKPGLRRKLKDSKWKSQRGLCAVCKGELPEKNCVLDRFEAMRGYTLENTQLICSACDTKLQMQRGYK